VRTSREARVENPTGQRQGPDGAGGDFSGGGGCRLKPGDTVVEYTGGSTGNIARTGLRAKGYRLQIVSSDAFSQEKLDHMAALGAD